VCFNFVGWSKVVSSDSCFWELRQIRTFHLAQKLPHFEPNWRFFDVLISWLTVLQKPTNPQRKQAFYSWFLQNRENDIRSFQELAEKGGIQDSF
jgi:hypothetical protein